jgi:hypothetical protein
VLGLRLRFVVHLIVRRVRAKSAVLSDLPGVAGAVKAPTLAIFFVRAGQAGISDPPDSALPPSGPSSGRWRKFRIHFSGFNGLCGWWRGPPCLKPIQCRPSNGRDLRVLVFQVFRHARNRHGVPAYAAGALWRRAFLRCGCCLRILKCRAGIDRSDSLRGPAGRRHRLYRKRPG